MWHSDDLADINHFACIAAVIVFKIFLSLLALKCEQLSAIAYHYLKILFLFYTHELHHKCMETFFALDTQCWL